MTPAAPRLSVLLPCRDVARFLPAALDSLAQQSFGDFEVLAVDDGSTDETRALLHERAARDPRVRVIATPPTGIAAALARGLAEARGEFIARMDGDDIAHPDRFARQLERFDAEPELAACGTQVRYIPPESVRDGARRYERWINSLLTHDEIARDVFVECPLPHPTLMIRRAALERVGGYTDPPWPEDYELVLRLWAGGLRLGKVPEVLLEWREREDRLSRTDPRYGEAAFRRCKVTWLRRTLLRDYTDVVVWGAGPVGKSFARELQRQGVHVRAFIDIDPRKIGQCIHGATVLPRERIDACEGAFIVAAVGSDAARADIRAELDAAGRTELRDYAAVA